MYRPPIFKTTEVVSLLKSIPRDKLKEFSSSWNKGEIIPDNAADASWCFNYAELFGEIH